MNIKPEKRVYRLKNQVQNYAWGAKGRDALIPRLLGIETDEDIPYAELWMGAHPKAPSAIFVDHREISLREFISMYPKEILGRRVSEKFSNELPFLLKVLSAAEPLSIQAHPNKEQAKYLHEKDPGHYPDSNHKPELAVALGPFTALVGFKSFSEIVETLKNYPEIEEFIGSSVAEEVISKMQNYCEVKEGLRELFSTLIRNSISRPDTFHNCLNRLKERLSGGQGQSAEVEKLFLELSSKYEDIGLFAIFFLNVVHLERGQGIFIDAGIPHAYVKGDIIECMANSDNVVRVGLTPKFKDAEALLEILTYESGPASVVEGEMKEGETTYWVDVEEFVVRRLEIQDREKRHISLGGALEIGLVVEGVVDILWEDDSRTRRESFKKGDSFLVPAMVGEYDILGNEGSEIYRVGVPV